MRGGCYRTHSTARGMSRGQDGYLKRIVISLDDETFDEVLVGARANECSFAAQARMLIEVGLETLKTDIDLPEISDRLSTRAGP